MPFGKRACLTRRQCFESVIRFVGRSLPVPDCVTWPGLWRLRAPSGQRRRLAGRARGGGGLGGAPGDGRRIRSQAGRGGGAGAGRRTGGAGRRGGPFRAWRRSGGTIGGRGRRGRTGEQSGGGSGGAAGSGGRGRGRRLARRAAPGWRWRGCGHWRGRRVQPARPARPLARQAGEPALRAVRGRPADRGRDQRVGCRPGRAVGRGGDVARAGRRRAACPGGATAAPGCATDGRRGRGRRRQRLRRAGRRGDRLRDGRRVFQPLAAAIAAAPANGSRRGVRRDVRRGAHR